MNYGYSTYPIVPASQLIAEAQQAQQLNQQQDQSQGQMPIGLLSKFMQSGGQAGGAGSSPLGGLLGGGSNAGVSAPGAISETGATAGSGAGMGAGAGGGSLFGGAGSGGASSLSAAGPWALLAAAIIGNEREGIRQGYRSDNPYDYAKDVLGGKVLEQDVHQRWTPKFFGSDKYGFGADSNMGADLATLDFGNAWKTLKNDSTLSKLFKIF